MTPSRNPCIACGKQETTGVAYGSPDEIKFWCAAHLPDEFRPAFKQRSWREMFDLWAEVEEARERKAMAHEWRLREDDDG